MLVAISAVPFIISRAVNSAGRTICGSFLWRRAWLLWPPESCISLQDAQVWRMWILPITVAVGLVVAVPLGFYDTAAIADAPMAAPAGLRLAGADT